MIVAGAVRSGDEIDARGFGLRRFDFLSGWLAVARFLHEFDRTMRFSLRVSGIVSTSRPRPANRRCPDPCRRLPPSAKIERVPTWRDRFFVIGTVNEWMRWDYAVPHGKRFQTNALAPAHPPALGSSVWATVIPRGPGPFCRRRKKVTDRLSLSVFAIEVDGKPILTFEAKLYSEAEAIVADERLRTTLLASKSGGVSLSDEHSILRLRLAHSDEAKRYKDAVSLLTDDLKLVYLIDLDPPE